MPRLLFARKLTVPILGKLRCYRCALPATVVGRIAVPQRKSIEAPLCDTHLDMVAREQSRTIRYQ